MWIEINERGETPDGKWQVVLKELTEDMAAEMECSSSTEEQWQRALTASPSPPEVREVTEGELAQIIAGILYEWGGSGQGVDDLLADVCAAQGEVVAHAIVRLRLLAPSDQDVTGDAGKSGEGK